MLYSAEENIKVYGIMLIVLLVIMGIISLCLHYGEGVPWTDIFDMFFGQWRKKK